MGNSLRLERNSLVAVEDDDGGGGGGWARLVVAEVACKDDGKVFLGIVNPLPLLECTFIVESGGDMIECKKIFHRGGK